MNTNKYAIKSIFRAYTSDVEALARGPLSLYRSMRWMLETAEISTSGPNGCLTVKGLVALWFATLRIWERDESEDMARTMAALDKNLRRAERLSSMLPFSSPLRCQNVKPSPDHVHA